MSKWIRVDKEWPHPFVPVRVRQRTLTQAYGQFWGGGLWLVNDEFVQDVTHWQLLEGPTEAVSWIEVNEQPAQFKPEQTEANDAVYDSGA
jgi:hypothetical protein